MALYQSNARLLRMALYANGAFSLLTGAACLLAPDSIARWIFASESPLFRLAAPGLVLELGIGLLVFAAFVLWTASRSVISQLTAKIITVMDVGWVLGSAALLLFTPDLWTSAGVWTVASVAVAVGLFAMDQAIGLAVLYQGHNKIETKWDDGRLIMTASGQTSAAPERVWSVMTDHEGYAAVADNLSKVEVLDGTGADTQRRCFDTRGRGWTENCILWDEGRAFAFRVNTEAPDYPYPIAQLMGEWSLSADPEVTRIHMRFEISPKDGLLNGLMLRLMVGPFARTCDRLLMNWIAVMEDRQMPSIEIEAAQAEAGVAQAA